MNPIDRLLNSITMYRLMLYGLGFLAIYTIALSFLGKLIFTPLELGVLLLLTTSVCFFGNLIIANFYKAIINVESSLITGLILYFLFLPTLDYLDLIKYFVAALIAMLSKYIITTKKKHILNPAAFGVFILLFLQNGPAWWVGTSTLLPITLILGLLVVRKLRRFQMFLTFLFVSLIFYLFQSVMLNKEPLIDEILLFFNSFPVIFFGTIMLTEPLTSPTGRKMQFVYALIAGILFSNQFKLPFISLTPELTLLICNLFAYLFIPKYKLFLHLLSVKEIASKTYEITFTKPSQFKFQPGQYLEWTLPFLRQDSRGNRRFFTIASSPTESDIKIGVKIPDSSSSFKANLKTLKKDTIITGHQVSGEFVLPKNKDKKLVFIAGGIGITPFRSMVQYIIDSKEIRDIVLFYLNKTQDEIAYRNVFDNSYANGVNTIYLLSDSDRLPANWKGEVGRLTSDIISKHSPDYLERTFYISGPSAMVTTYKKLLKDMGIESKMIKTDYFPGF